MAAVPSGRGYARSVEAAAVRAIDGRARARHCRPVKLYLIRHSNAVDAGDGISDGHRFLSAEGRTRCREVGRVLREAGVTLDAVVTSPLVRAVQTAELLADAVNYLGEIASHTAFTPGVPPEVTMAEVLGRGSAVAVVGHEPSISDLAAFVVGQPGFAPFRTCQVCFFEDRKPVWKLRPDALQLQDLHCA